MAQHVFIVWENPIFFDSIRLLLTQLSIEVVGDSQVYAEALDAIEKVRPEMVVIEETAQNKSEELQRITHLLEDCSWGPYVFRMSLQDNEMWVYHRRRWTINDKEDLFEIIRGTDTKPD